MKRLFLTSQVQYVAADIASKLGNDVGKPMVFINTCVKERVHDDLGWHERNKTKMHEAGFRFDEYDIAGKSEQQLRQDLATYSQMYIEGGNGFYLLQEAESNNFVQFVREFIAAGHVYIGTSAGSTVCGPDLKPILRQEKLKYAPRLTHTAGFGVVDFSILPHWGDPTKKDDYLKQKLVDGYNRDWELITLTDNQYVEVRDDWYRIVDISQK